MDSEGKFWATVSTVVVGGVVFVALIITNYYANMDRLMTDAIKNGTNPIAVRCAFNPQQSDGALCQGVK